MNSKAWIALLIGIIIIGSGIYLMIYHVGGSGNVITEYRETSEFDSIKVNIATDIELVSAPTNFIEITIDDNLATYLSTDVNDNRLTIRYTRWVGQVTQCKIRLGLPSVENIFVSGSANITSDGLLTGIAVFTKIIGEGIVNLTVVSDSISNQISGSGRTILNADTGLLYNQLSGGGEIRLSGLADEIVCDLNGLGSIYSTDLQSERGRVTISGSGAVIVNVKNELTAVISGNGSLKYIGSPKILAESTGMGKIEKIIGVDN